MSWLEPTEFTDLRFIFLLSCLPRIAPPLRPRQASDLTRKLIVAKKAREASSERRSVTSPECF